mmetsp:Transcript_23290/g.46538  ORF Transcript_23290/g.46538 Transcript_23290/m.46538 type:complete len:429 (+) Transcript_23290:299-1585(+)
MFPFDEKFESDHRQPLFTFSIPSALVQALVGTGTYYDIDGQSADNVEFGFLAPSLSFWIQMPALMGVQVVVCSTIAAIMHKFIVKKRGSTTAYLVGYAFVVPCVCWFPFYAIELLDIRNKCFRMNLCFTPLLVIFRCLAAMHGTSPPVVETTFNNYCLYNTSVIELEFDEKSGKPVKATYNDVVGPAKEFIKLLCLLGVLYSIVEITGYAPFGTVEKTGEGMTWVFHPKHLANNFFVAYITQLNLAAGTSGAASTVSLLLGKKTKKVTNNAMLESTSVSDFWGRRWNQLVHGALKGGVFKPLRKHNFSKEISATATFLASGLIHEYVLAVMCHSYGSGDDYFHHEKHYYGVHLAFFLYNGILIVLEYAFIGTVLHKKISELSLPSPVLTCMVIGSALPIAHWFTEEYVRHHIYDGLKVGCPMIVTINY